MIDAKGIEALIAPSLESLGYRLLRAVFTGGKHRPTLQIMIERADGVGVTVDDCSLVSNTVSTLLDVADPIDTSYMLEVTSPGIDRPLLRPEDYARFAGFEAKVELSQPHDGRRRFRGKIMGLDGDAVKIRVEDSDMTVPYASIQKAKLVLTDELIAATGDAKPRS